MEEFISIHITCPEKEVAENIAEQLVLAGLVACAQIEGPISSIYHWKNEIEQDQEWRLILKTIHKNYKEIENLVLSIHPYDVPQILSFRIDNGYHEYLGWLTENSN